MALTRRKLYCNVQKLGPRDVTRTVSYGAGGSVLNFLHLSIYNCGHEQRNGFQKPIIIFNAESDSVNNSCQCSGEVHLVGGLKIKSKSKLELESS